MFYYDHESIIKGTATKINYAIYKLESLSRYVHHLSLSCLSNKNYNDIKDYIKFFVDELSAVSFAINKAEISVNRMITEYKKGLHGSCEGEGKYKYIVTKFILDNEGDNTLCNSNKIRVKNIDDELDNSMDIAEFIRDSSNEHEFGNLYVVLITMQGYVARLNTLLDTASKAKEFI